MCMYALPLTTSLYWSSPNCMQLFYIIKLIMFPLWLAIVITFYFFIWLLIVKTDKHLLLLWLCICYSLNTIVLWLVNRKIIEHFITKWSEIAQSCPTLCDPMDCSLLGFSVHEIFQVRILVWVAISYKKTCRVLVTLCYQFKCEWQEKCLLTFHITQFNSLDQKW